jgi:rSAM/selenodomain-associated transferase 2
MKISVIIPTLNEALYIRQAIHALKDRWRMEEPYEIIVSDCGSSDGTADIARRQGVRVIAQAPLPKSRAEALNRGVAASSGEYLFFADADSIPPEGYDGFIHKALEKPGIIGGAFELKLDQSGFALRVVEFINRIRYRICPCYYGDQGIFVKTSAFHQVNGYTERRILEASDFCEKLRKIGRIVLIKKNMITSSRRFIEGGVFRVFFRDIKIWWYDLIGKPTERFAVKYQNNNLQRARSSTG